MKSIFFDSQVTYDTGGQPIYDRPNDASDLRTSFASLISNGVFINPQTNFQVLSGSSGMTIRVLPGKCWIQGAFAWEATDTRELIVQASESLDRIDRVVLRLNLSFEARNIDLYIRKGTATTTPKPPILQRDDTIWELGLADLFINANSGAVAQQRITDTRLNTALCGVVHGTFEQVDTTTIFDQFQAWYETTTQQYETDFNVWFQSIQDILDENIAAHLQNQVDDLNTNAIRGIRGNGNPIPVDSNKIVNITPSNIGAAPATHNHAATQITSGILPLTYGGVGANTAEGAANTLLFVSRPNTSIICSVHASGSTVVSAADGWAVLKEGLPYGYFSAHVTTWDGDGTGHGHYVIATVAYAGSVWVKFESSFSGVVRVNYVLYIVG